MRPPDPVAKRHSVVDIDDQLTAISIPTER
jgi:hypothetical protein